MSTPGAGGETRLSGRALLVLLAIALVCAAPFWLVPPGTLTEVEVRLEPPFAAHGKQFLAHVVFPRRVLSNEPHSPRPTVHENGTKIGRPQSTIAAPEGDAGADTRQRLLAFKPADRSDPNTNGRSYSARYARPRVPFVAYLAMLLVVSVIVFALVGWTLEQLLAKRPGLRRAAFAIGFLVLSAVLLQWTFAVATAHRLAAGGGSIQVLFNQVFHGRGSGSAGGNTMNFEGHHYLNFVVNPDAAYMRERQFDRRYRIRRKEPIRPRSQVAWRALAIGGSTTFGTRLPDEEDTWPFRLEQKMRAAHGPDYDVINGGAPGYNVIENFFHYVLFLEDLDPDVVILFVGINDVHPRLRGDIARDYSNSRIRWQSHTLPRLNPLLAPLTFYQYAVLRDLERRRFGHLYEYIQRPNPPRREWPAALERNGPEIYEAHLRNFVRLLLAQGRRVVVVPQVYFLFGERDRIWVEAVAQHNAVNEALAREFGLPFAAEVTTAFDRADLIDNCHFNAVGGEKMAALLSKLLESAGAISASGTPHAPGRFPGVALLERKAPTPGAPAS